MGNKNTKEIKKSDYENCCLSFKDYFMREKNELKLENIKKDINKKIEEKVKKTVIFNFIKNLLEKEKKEKILNKFQEIFINLFEQYEKIHRKEEENIKKISEDINNNKNIINAIYISKIFEDEEEIEDVKIHDYSVYLFGEDVVKEIEEGNNKNIDEDFKKYFHDEIEIKQEEIEEKFNEICKSKNIDPKNYENNNESNNKIFDNNNQKNLKKKDDLFQFYDIIFNIESFEKLKKNGWEINFTEKGLKKYIQKNDKRNTVVSVVGNNNVGKTYILSKLSNIEIPDGFNITTKGLSAIYYEDPEYEDSNIIFLYTAGFERPLCENDNFNFETKNENYLKLNEEEKKNVSIKNYLTEDEFITQIMKFTRDRQNTDYFLQKFIMNSANILLCIVNLLNLSDHKFLNRIIEENKNKKIFIIHNLKTLKTKKEVQDYIDEILLKLITSKLQKAISIKIHDENKKNNVEENKFYYRQVFENEDNYHRDVIHLFMANDNSEAGEYYNKSTLEFIKFQIIAFCNNYKFPIIEKVKDFLYEHSEDFFNVPLENSDDIKIIDDNENGKKLKYTGESFELKECYFDELGNANFIQSNYKPSYRAYKVKYKDENGESNKLIIDVEISKEVNLNDIENPEIFNKNRQNIIIIEGRRNLKKIKLENNIILAEYKKSIFDDENNIFNLRIYIPNEKCIIKNLYKRIFNLQKGLYRYIYNIETYSDPFPDPDPIEDEEEDYEI